MSSIESNNNNVVSSHYETHSSNQSYEQAYFYEPGAYMQHLVSLTQERLQLNSRSSTEKYDESTTMRRRILDIGGGTGNFAQELLSSSASE